MVRNWWLSGVLVLAFACGDKPDEDDSDDDDGDDTSAAEDSGGDGADSGDGPDGLPADPRPLTITVSGSAPRPSSSTRSPHPPAQFEQLQGLLAGQRPYLRAQGEVLETTRRDLRSGDQWHRCRKRLAEACSTSWWIRVPGLGRVHHGGP